MLSLGAAELPWNSSFEITTKLDGSMFFYTPMTPAGIPVSATRGAFESEQAKKGREILQKKYNSVSF